MRARRDTLSHALPVSFWAPQRETLKQRRKVPQALHFAMLHCRLVANGAILGFFCGRLSYLCCPCRVCEEGKGGNCGARVCRGRDFHCQSTRVTVMLVNGAALASLRRGSSKCTCHALLGRFMLCSPGAHRACVVMRFCPGPHGWPAAGGCHISLEAFMSMSGVFWTCAFLCFLVGFSQ